MSIQSVEEADLKQGLDLGVGFALAIAVATVGGFLCGKAIDNYGELGSASLWGLGVVAGMTARSVMSRPRKPVGYALAIAVCIAFLIAEIAWIRWNIKDVESWGQAVRLFPQFCKDYSWTALLGSIFTFFGASSAYKSAGVRYRLVEVVEE